MPRSRYASFALALPLYRVFDYAIDESAPVLPGVRYRLPFANGYKTGILLETSDASDVDPARIRPVRERLDPEPVLDAHLLELARWIADYYLQPLGEVVFLCLPGQLRGARPYTPVRVKRWHLSDRRSETIAALKSRSPRQYEICVALGRAPAGLTAAEFKAINPAWHGVLKTLEAKGIVRWRWADDVTRPAAATAGPVPSAEQAQIIDKIGALLDRFAVHLLDGVTGSGKTEIYLRLIAASLDAGRQVIYLVPEIGLTSQLIDRVSTRFGDCFALSHSGLTDLQRFTAWDRFRRGEARIMLGTRSCLFSAAEDLGLIIIDEEHDPSYRQEDGVRYHARDVAIKRAQMLAIPIVLGSATPSLEILANCEREFYHRYRLDRRPTRYPPPSIRLIDVRHGSVDFGFSRQLLQRVDRHLSREGQVLVYLNRRGFAPLVMCHECGWQALCRHCDARLTLHQSVSSLVCHHCGFSQPLPANCPECGHAEIRHYGIGTEQLEQGLRQRYPEIPVLRIDRDAIASREALKSRLRQLRSGDPCILIGTQMIAKGHDYPAITLSLILDADQALFSAAYRASERLAQTLFQVAGRAGRGDREGEAWVQTRFPEHPLMQALVSRDYRSIARELLDERRQLGFPPYARVAIFRADAPRLEPALELLEQIRAQLASVREISRVDCIGPLPALMTRRVGRYRAQLTLLARDYRALRAVLGEAMPRIARLPTGSRVSWSIDVDATDL